MNEPIAHALRGPATGLRSVPPQVEESPPAPSWEVGP